MLDYLTIYKYYRFTFVQSLIPDRWCSSTVYVLFWFGGETFQVSALFKSRCPPRHRAAEESEGGRGSSPNKSLVQRVGFESQIPERQSVSDKYWWVTPSTPRLIWAAVTGVHDNTVRVFPNAPLMRRGAFIDLCRERWATKRSSAGVSELLIFVFVTGHQSDVSNWYIRGHRTHKRNSVSFTVYWFKYRDLRHRETQKKRIGIFLSAGKLAHQSVIGNSKRYESHGTWIRPCQMFTVSLTTVENFGHFLK